MSDMDDFVDVSVTLKGRQISAGRYQVPVTIGRGEHNAVRIGHDPQVATISRTHVSIQRQGDGLQLVDNSVNGTIYRGERMRQGTVVQLGASDHFNIFEFEISVAKARYNPAIPVILEAHVLVDGVMKGKPFLIGEMLLLCFKTNGGYRFDQAPRQADFQAIFSRHRIDAEHLFAAIAADDYGKGLLATQLPAERPAMTINRHLVVQQYMAIEPRTVIEMDNIRIELYPPGEHSLKCSNPSCQLLNPYDLNGNCIYCSFGLVGAVTRLASPGGLPKG
jgi:hypothetical protein